MMCIDYTQEKTLLMPCLDTVYQPCWLTDNCSAVMLPEVSDVQLVDGSIGPGGSRGWGMQTPTLWHCHVILHRHNL